MNVRKLVNSIKNRQQKKPKAPRANRNEPGKTIEIKIELPASFNSLSRENTKKYFSKLIKTKPTSKTKIIGGLVALALITVLSSSYLMPEEPEEEIASGKPVTGPVKGTPDFNTLLPKGKSIGELGGWNRINPPNSKPAFTYVDQIGKVSISVSQQPLPEKLKASANEQVEQLAQSFGANDILIVGKTRVHIGTSADGPQSVILHKNDLLILIKSTSKVSSDQWREYIDSLR